MNHSSMCLCLHLCLTSVSAPQLRTSDPSQSETGFQKTPYTPTKRGKKKKSVLLMQYTLLKMTDKITSSLRCSLFQNCSPHRDAKITCRSESMPSKLRRRLRSTVSPFLSRSICSKIPSTVRAWTVLSLTMCVRNSSSPVSLQHYSKRNKSHDDSVSR